MRANALIAQATQWNSNNYVFNVLSGGMVSFGKQGDKITSAGASELVLDIAAEYCKNQDDPHYIGIRCFSLTQQLLSLILCAHFSRCGAGD